MGNDIYVYVDETYLDDRSGLIQSAFCLPKNNHSGFELAVDALKATHPAIFPPVEFKGSSLSQGNVAVYRDFLAIAFNHIGQVSDKSPLRTITTIESLGRLEDKNFAWIYDHLKGAAANLRVTAHNLDYFLKESARQLWWIFRFIDKICTSPIPNEFIFVFDNKQRYGQMCRSTFDLVHPTLGPVKWSGGKLISSFARTLLSTLGKNEGKWMPIIRGFDFGFSSTQRQLQVSDLISNLFFSSLKGELGFVSEAVTLKHGLFMSFMSGRLANELYSDLNVTAVSGNDQLVATGTKFGGCIQYE
jgi:hypothetical protein